MGEEPTARLAGIRGLVGMYLAGVSALTQARAGAAADTGLMSVSGDRRKSLRNRAFGVAGAALAAGVLASCGVAGPGPAGTAASGSCPQASVLMPGQPGSLVVSSDLGGVAVSSAASVWAVGSTSMTDPMTMHWNGSAWTEEVLTLVKGQPGNPPGSFDAVAAVSPHDVWVVGVNAGEPLAEHWNGRVWTVVPTPSPGPQGSGAGAELYGIAAISARDAWAVGGTTGGAAWIIQPPGPGCPASVPQATTRS
ncbi:MAG: hypothetical protein ABSA02_38930 [Trebonia sp.]